MLDDLGLPDDDAYQQFDVDEINEGITALGYNKGVFYYLSSSCKQVFDLTAAQHTKSNFMAMASVAHFWERSRFSIDGKINWDNAFDWYMSACRQVGVYRPDKIRGRGAWIDKDRSVVHLGEFLIVDGVRSSLLLPASPHIYEAAPPLAYDLESDPLSNASAYNLVKICQMLRFERPIDGLLLAGFIALAPICGALTWRPSIWITGGTGTGKSWIEQNIIAKSLGKLALSVTSKTSEAGIRQALGSDARPVIFDEAEGEDLHAATRMQGVLDLVRQSSSESGADIIKGSADQSGAKRYRIRSCFLFSSINVGLEHSADENRVTVLALRAPATHEEKEADHAKFKDLRALASATITNDFCAGLLARSAKLMVTIRHNAEVFAEEATIKFGSRRMGDQIGSLLAGAYSLHTTKQITAPEAAAWLSKNCQDFAPPQEQDRDEVRLLGHLTQKKLRVSRGNGSSEELTIARLLDAAWGFDEMLAADIAERELKQIGIKTDMTGIIVSTKHPAIKGFLTGTPWAKQWSKALMRLDGAKSLATTRFLNYTSCATSIPLIHVTGEKYLTYPKR